jgi:tRNA(fMet)-specific endonuclease VapC
LGERPVLDSDVLIDYLRGRGPGNELLGALATTLAYQVTAISAFELALGRSYAVNPPPVHALLAVPVLTLTREAALRAGSIFREQRMRGTPIDMRDAMQAGICTQAQLPLVTRNVRHFDGIAGLRVAHPQEWLELATGGS